jgi:hypothetical protein
MTEAGGDFQGVSEKSCASRREQMGQESTGVLDTASRVFSPPISTRFHLGSS